MECHFCREEIKDNALKCKHCGEWLDGRPTTSLESLKDSTLKSSQKLTTEVKDIYQSIFGSNKFKNPSNSDPLIIDETLSLLGDHFISGDHKISYSEVVGVESNYQSFTYNYLMNTKDIYLEVDYRSKIGPRKIFLNSSTFMVRLKKFKLIQNAQLVFSSRSYPYRKANYINQLLKKGYIKYEHDKKSPEVLIHKNGLLKVGSKSINLIEAKKNGGLGLHGMSYKSLSQLSNKHDPYTIGAATGSGGVFSQKVVFNASYNFDVIREILSMIANEEVPPFAGITVAKMIGDPPQL